MEKSKWIIIREGYANGYHNCESPSKSRPNSHCGSTDKLLMLAKADKISDSRWVCAKHTKQDYEIVGQWSKSWEYEFEPKAKKEVNHE